MYRICDGSICGSCLNFEHECYEEYCGEWCMCENDDVENMFYDLNKPIIECKCFNE